MTRARRPLDFLPFDSGTLSCHLCTKHGVSDNPSHLRIAPITMKASGQTKFTV